MTPPISLVISGLNRTATLKPRKWIPIPIRINRLKDRIANLIMVLPVILICFIVEVEPEIQINCICVCPLIHAVKSGFILNIFLRKVKLSAAFEGLELIFNAKIMIINKYDYLRAICHYLSNRLIYAKS